jgi:outer membrane protein TolC
MLLLLFALVSVSPDTLELSLGQALDLAVRGSPAQAQASASRLSSGVAVGRGINALLPTASGSLDYGRTTSQLVAGSDSTVTTRGWDGNFTLSQVVFDPRVFAGVVTSFINAGYYTSDAQDKQARLVYDVTDGYLGLLGARLLRDAAASAVDRADDNVKLNQEKLRLGAASRIDVMRSEVFKSQADISLLTAEKALAAANAGFLATAGISRDVIVKPTEQLTEPAGFEVPNRDSLVAEIERRNPGARLAAKAGTIATVNTVAAIGQVLPSVSAFWSSDYFDSAFPQSIKDWSDQDRVTTGIRFSLPLLDIKSFVLDIADAVAGSRRAKAAARAAVYQVRAAAATAVLGYDEARQRYDYAKKNLELNQELYRLAQEQQRLGAISLIDFFSVETALEQANATHITALTDTYIQAAQINYLLGRTDYRPKSE